MVFCNLKNLNFRTMGLVVVLYALLLRHLGIRKIARAISPFVSRSYNAVCEVGEEA